MDFKGIIRRRKGIFLVTFLMIILIVSAIAVYLPPIYSAEATIVIENQEIPEEYVKSTITTYVNERLHNIEQRVMSRDKLMEIIHTYGLYPEMDSTAEMVDKMRKAIQLRPIDIQISDKQSGRQMMITTAFILSYEGSDPVSVEKVTNLLADLFIKEDKQAREQMAGTTTGFFEKELKGLKQEVLRHEKKISEFKIENIEKLPGSTTINLQAISRLELDLDRIDTRVQTLRQKKILFQGQIANTEALMPVMTEDGKMASNPSERLKYLRLQLIRLQASLLPKHPDIKALKNEIAELEAQVGETDASVEKIRLLVSLQSQLAQSQAKLGKTHPDVVRLSKEVEILSNEVDQLGMAKIITQISDEKPDNPAYMNLKTQILITEEEIKAAYSERKKIEEKLEDYRKKLEMVPLVEEEYNKLTMDYENAKHKYNEILNKLLTAKISREMDMGQSGERFTITEQAVIPEAPSKPDRIKIILLGIVLGLGTGIALAALKEGLDHSVKSADDIESITGVPVIGTISIFNPRIKKESIG